MTAFLTRREGRLAGAARGLLALCTGAVLALASPWAGAQIRIGQTAGFSGPVAAGVKEITDGAKLVLDAVNAKGGIGGQPIQLVSLDDRFEPKLAAENARKLIDQGVLALFLTRGTPHAQAILPLLQEAGLALVAPSTGAMLLHQPVQPWVFNVRSPYQREAERVVRHLLGVGTNRLAILQVDDSFGDDAAQGALRALGSTKPVMHERFSRERPAFGPLAARVQQLDAQAVLLIGTATAVVDGVKALRAAGSGAQVATLSNNASQGFTQALGAQGRGVIVAQVMPSERALRLPLVLEAHELLRAANPQAALTPQNLEGFVAAKVLVEGLRRAQAARDLSRAGLQRALDNLGRVDLGGLEVGYSPTDHTGLDYVDLSIIGADGHFRR